MKQDAIPGIAQPVWLTPTRTGEWEIACSQLCGLGHYRMRDFSTAQTQADDVAWLAEEAAISERAVAQVARWPPAILFRFSGKISLGAHLALTAAEGNRPTGGAWNGQAGKSASRAEAR